MFFFIYSFLRSRVPLCPLEWSLSNTNNQDLNLTSVLLPREIIRFCCFWPLAHYINISNVEYFYRSFILNTATVNWKGLDFISCALSMSRCLTLEKCPCAFHIVSHRTSRCFQTRSNNRHRHHTISIAIFNGGRLVFSRSRFLIFTNRARRPPLPMNSKKSNMG